jgi:O-antigen/teichoic acid export membrane protein
MTAFMGPDSSDHSLGPREAGPLVGETGARYIRGGALRVGAYSGAILASVVVMPFVTRHLRSVGYGRYVTVTSLILIVASLSEGGISSLGVREFTSAPDAERREFMRSLIALRIALSTLGGAAAIVFAAAVGYPSVVVAGTAVAAAGLVATTLQNTLAAPLTAALRLHWLAAIDFAGPATTALCLIALVVAGSSLLGFYAAVPAGCLVALVLTVALVRSEVTLRPAFDLRRWRALLRESVVFAVATGLATVYFQLVVVAMSVISNGYQTGVFSLGFRILAVVNGIPLVLVTSAFPILLRAASDDRERLRYTLQRLIEGNLLLGGWLSLLVVAGAPFAVHVIGGPGYHGAATVLRILGAGVIATFLWVVFSVTLLSLRAYRVLITTSSAMVALAIVLCALLIPAHGARGAAIVTLTLEVTLALAYAIALVARERSLAPTLALPARILAALAIAFAAALAAPVSSLPSALIGTVVLALAALALRALPVELAAALRRPRG